MTHMPRFVSPIFATALALAVLPNFPANAEDKPMNRTITVSASGTVEAVPDQARISTGVSIEAPTAREALSQNTGLMRKVVDDLKSKGVEARDIQTASFNVEPVMDYSKDGQAPRVRGYRVNNQVVVLVRNLDGLGNILDDVVSAGSNHINGLSFEVSKADELKDQARTEAVANALRRAKLLAAASGAEVGKVVQISEEVSSPMPVAYSAPRLAKADMAAPIERGTETLEARVTITWELK